MGGFSGYNKTYQEEYEARASTPLGQRLYRARWDLIQHFCDKGSLLDFGCASGAFHEQAPLHFDATGWDINPASPYHRPQPVGHFDILTLWDVIEHLPSPHSPIIAHTPDTVFIVTPNAAVVTLGNYPTWKHFKPAEHIHYYTTITLIMSMAAIGYDVENINHIEGRLRDSNNPFAIITGIFTKHS